MRFGKRGYSARRDRERAGLLAAVMVLAACCVVGYALVETDTVDESDAAMDSRFITSTKLTSDQVRGGVALVVPAGYTVTLSLNGHYMQATGVAAMLEVYGTLIIKDLAGGGYIQGGYPEAGGAIWVADGGKVVLNSVDIRGGKTTYGGAIYVSSGGTVVMNGGSVTGGEADYGGCVYVAEGGTFTMNGGTISGGTAVNGGCVYSAGTFTMSSGTISGGNAQYGGALAVGQNGTIAVSGGEVRGSKAAQNGGGAVVSTGGTLTINGCTFRDNSSSATGGAISIDVGGRVVMNSGVIAGNTAKTFGGGVYTKGSFEMRGGSISSNTAENGGGLAILTDVGMTRATADVSAGQISDNTASRYGGGIYISRDYESSGVVAGNGFLTMTGGTVSGNTALRGGGIYTAVQDSVTTVTGIADISGATVSGNTATQRGGGIFGNGYVLNDVTVTRNSAPWGGGLSGAALTMTSCTVTLNTATERGGGINLVNRGRSYITDCVISNNTSGEYGGGLYLQSSLEFSGTRVEGNSAAKDGGGIYVDGDYRSIYLRSGTVSGNTAARDGGGIYDYESGGLYIYDGMVLRDNHASGSGGALLIHSGGHTYITGGEFIGNTAGVKETAGIDLASSGEILYISGTPVICGNGASGDMSYGLYLTSGNYPHINGYVKSGAMVMITTASTPTESRSVKVFQCDSGSYAYGMNLGSYFFSSAAGTAFYVSDTAGYIGYNATAFPVEYHSNNGSDQWSLAVMSSSSGSVASCMFTHGGTRFLGWATSADGDVVYQPGATYSDIGSRSSALKLYAVWDEGYYFLHFSANGGTGSAGPEIMYENRSYTLPGSETFTREGYVIVGWSTDPTASTATWLAGQTVSHLSTGGTVTLYAVWNAVMVSVTWKDTDGTVLLEQEVAYGTVPTYVGKIPDHDTHVTDYTLSGWSEEITSTVLTWSPVVREVTEDTVFTAVYTTEVRFHEVSVSVNDASMGSVSSITLDVPYGARISIVGTEVTVTYNDESITVQAVPSDGDGRYTYYLENWIVDGIELDEMDGYTVEYDVELTAVFDRAGSAYTVSFDANGGEGTMAAQVLVYGEAEALNAVAFTNEGYTFAGWATSADGTPAYADSQSVTEVGDATLYAVWARGTVAVTVSAVNGTVDAALVNAPLGSGISFHGGTLLVNGIAITAAPSETGSAATEYVFSHWEIGGQELTDDTTVSGATGIVAVFSEETAKVQVTWIDHDGTVLLTEEIAYGTDPEYTGATPSRESTDTVAYTFDGWSMDVSDNTGDIEMTAQYEESVREYVVVVGVYGEGWGDVPVYNVSVPYGADIGVDGTYLTVNGTVFMPSGYDDDDQYEYTFAGWDVADGTKVTADMDIRAVYTATVKTYTVTWLNADGTVLLEQEVAYGTVPEYTGETPEYTASSEYGMVLTGWAPQVSAVDGDAEYVAAYSETYTIEFDANGGFGSKSSITAAVLSDTDLGSCPYLRLGYSFAGWSTEAGGDVEIADGAAVQELASAGGTVTLYAVWEEDSFSYLALAGVIVGIIAVIGVAYALVRAYRN